MRADQHQYRNFSLRCQAVSEHPACRVLFCLANNNFAWLAIAGHQLKGFSGQQGAEIAMGYFGLRN